jgi:uncharacterized protein YegP (UPF0339 family)
MPAQFIIKKAKDGQFYFHLTAANNEIILASEMYKAKSGATNGIESVKKNSAVEARYEKLASKGKFYFVLKAANNQVIGTSEMYTTERARDDGILAVKKVGPTAPIKEKLE